MPNKRTADNMRVDAGDTSSFLMDDVSETMEEHHLGENLNNQGTPRDLKQSNCDSVIESFHQELESSAAGGSPCSKLFRSQNCNRCKEMQQKITDVNSELHKAKKAYEELTLTN